jgi:hypothetical protein
MRSTQAPIRTMPSGWELAAEAIAVKKRNGA